jgi:cullin 4
MQPSLPTQPRQQPRPGGRSHNSGPPKKLTIRPFARAPRMPDNFLADTWSTYLLPAVNAVHADTVVPFSLELIYRKVEDACMHKHAPGLYAQLRDVCDAHAAAIIVALVDAPVVDSHAFLQLADNAWQRHCAHMLRIRALFLPLDRSYVAQSQTDTRSLWDLGLSQYRAHFIKAFDVERKTISAVLTMINNDRDAETVEMSRVRSVLRMLAAINMYESSFQEPFLTASSEYFQAEAERMVADVDVPTFLAHTERRLSQEAERSINTFSPATRHPLIVIIEQRLVADHVPTLLEKGFDVICDERRKADLHRFYSLFARVNSIAPDGSPCAHEQMKTYVIAYVKRVGLGIVMDKEKDAQMVTSLLALKAQLDEFVVESFGGSEMFSNAINYAFESFVNARENKPAELIAKFLDGILRTGNKALSEEELERTLDCVLTLFRFIDSKDVFEAFYKKDLSKRLLHDKSASHDLEKAMISKLKTECGSQFTSKLEGMYRDIESSKDLIASFRHLSRNRADTQNRDADAVELNAFVLEAARWPLTSQLAEIKLPRQLLEYQESYKQFYLSKHAGRKLTWQHFDGSCVVKASFTKGTKILTLSLYQTVVTVLFSDVDQLSYNEIAESSGIESKELKRTLLSLACGKVRLLQKQPKGPRIDETDSFLFNSTLTHKQMRIKINAIQMKETVEENKGTTEKVFQERGYQIDASLVRIMKTRKTLHHAALIAEVYNQLKFPHKPADVKKRISSLIEREYIERDPNDPQRYIYLA